MKSIGMTSDDNDTPDDEKQAEVRIDPASLPQAQALLLGLFFVY